MPQPEPPLPPPDLFHYTGPAGLLGILGDGTRERAAGREVEVWASDARYLNDASELRHAFARFRRLLRGTRDNGLAMFTDRVLSEVARAATLDALPPTFVASLTPRADDLSQWRAYCPRTGGYALGFDGHTLEEAAEGYALRPCIYDRRTQLARMADFPYRVSDEVRSLTEPLALSVGALPVRWVKDVPVGWLKLDEDGTREELVGAGLSADAWARVRGAAVARALALLAEHAPTIKHRAFRHEAEWRLVAASPALPATHYRAGRTALIPYRVVALPRAAVRRVVIGPTPHPELAEAALRGLLGKLGMSDVAVQRSRAPYRGEAV